jgi:hypothetical protein
MAGGFAQVVSYVQVCSPSSMSQFCRTMASNQELQRHAETAKGLWDYFTNPLVLGVFGAAGAAVVTYWRRLTKRKRPSA